MMNSSKIEHLSEASLIRLSDEEMVSEQRQEAQAHLAVCIACAKKWDALRQLSQQISNTVELTPVPDMDAVRQMLERRLVGAKPVSVPDAGKVMRRFGWGMGIAATLAFGILMVPRHDLAPPTEANAVVAGASGVSVNAIDVDGEKFLPVPYANADLATAAPHIVQMQVPVSSLTDLGIVFEPLTNRVGQLETERSVLADVLVGADGQPRGVHVIGWE